MRVPCTLALALLAGMGAAACHAGGVPAVAPAPFAGSTQLVVVTTPHWDATTGELRRYARADARSAWRAEGTAVPVVIGRTGLAWGMPGPHAGPQKREGDGRSPAGIFPVGSAFGFAPADSMRALRLPYLELTAGTECVDDTASAHYNAVVERAAVPRVDWRSSERMRQIGQYRLGTIIEYNTAPAVKGRGSCIFFHIWSGPASTTSGCTALEAAPLAELVAWFDLRARPVVVQLPAPEYERLRGEWGLPALR